MMEWLCRSAAVIKRSSNLIPVPLLAPGQAVRTPVMQKHVNGYSQGQGAHLSPPPSPWALVQNVVALLVRWALYQTLTLHLSPGLIPVLSSVWVWDRCLAGQVGMDGGSTVKECWEEEWSGQSAGACWDSLPHRAKLLHSSLSSSKSSVITIAPFFICSVFHVPALRRTPRSIN